MTLKREIKDAYLEGGNSIYVKTHSNAVYVDDNETETLTQRLDNVKDSITKHASQLDTNVKELNKVKNRIVSIYDLATINETTDIGAIINKYTEEYTIYLPNGIYRVDTPIVLKNSLIGCNVSRNTKVDTSKL